MKAKLILINWVLSFAGLCIDTERSPVWAVLLVMVWFGISSLLLRYADRRGWMDDICKRLKMETK